ncbi:MAG: hemolysin [Acidobacteria bacterium]|nr:MAG: hemolysin [Acidobacteriota bacterium]
MKEWQCKLRDPFSGISHLIGAFLSVGAIGILVVFAATYGNVRHIVSFGVYGFTMLLMYTSSALYHLLPLKKDALKILRRIDHMMIFLFIAGTYTPICLVGLKGAWGWSIFSVVWAIALLGILFKAFWLGAPRWLSTAVYILMGWVALIAIYPIALKFSIPAMAWLFSGGVFYTVGAIVYALKKPDFYPGVFGFHELWHLFVMFGSFCHFWLILRYVLYL